MASTRKLYDDCSTNLFYKQSTDPLAYRLSPNYANNCSKCYTDFGPRGQDMNVSVITNQNLVDVDSLLTNRSKVASDCKDGLVTDIKFNNYKKYNLPRCNNFMNRHDSRLTHPIHNYRGMTIDWFFSPRVNNRDEQCNLFWDFAENTQLTSKDNYRPDIPVPMNPYEAFPRRR
jgi:hypothetical protein